ncbi:amino acid ABC transporter permease [Anaerovorax odorimutans]|uniref:amino acid ABC transporter permease n=1 Tax=Anaerovorax odorimutans TaxID=109327 RepID=UPI0003F5582A|nr:ABC transporter permease subunit [Anaerovorax odorimutans]
MNEQFSFMVAFILQGLGLTLKVYAVTIIFSIPLGIICAIGKVSKFKPLVWLLDIYTWVFRGTPLLLQLIFAYFGLPLLGIEFSQENAAYITFILNYGAYFTEIFRAGIESIDKGQYEAAKVLGMSYGQTMRRIIIPQALKVVIPPTGNEAVTLIKDTALCSAIALSELLKNSKDMVSKFASIDGFVIAAIIYLILTFVIIQIFKLIEKRFRYYS